MYMLKNSTERGVKTTTVANIANAPSRMYSIFLQKDRIHKLQFSPSFVVSICVLFFALSLPLGFAHAAVNAGVVNGVWFSNPNPQEGEVVRIFTAVQNQSNETISGTVTFLVNDSVVGSKAFSVASNDVIPVSITYTFPGGTFNVSAYISAVEEQQSVTYTLAPKTSVSVTRKTQDIETQSTATPHASSTVHIATNAVVDAGKSVLATAEPIAEAAAGRVEQLRDALLHGTSSKSENELTTETTKRTASGTKAAAENLLATSKNIAKSTDIPLWKKATGVLLTVAAFLLRIWFVFVVLFVAFIAWRLVRGVRIR